MSNEIGADSDLKALEEAWDAMPEAERREIVKQALTTPMTSETLELIEKFQPIIRQRVNDAIYY